MSKYCNGCKKLVSNTKWNYGLALCDKCKYIYKKEERRLQSDANNIKKEERQLNKAKSLLKSDNVVLEYQRMKKYREV